MRLSLLIGIFLLFFRCYFSQETPVSVQVNTSKTIGETKRFWSFFGYDEPNCAIRENDRQLLTELQQLSSVAVYVRGHDLLTSKVNSKGPDAHISIPQ
jgi:xylan 1,4-beta-xylosidase